MGGGVWRSSDWDSYKSARKITSTSTVRDIYTSTRMKDTFNPSKIKVRESCDSLEHPNSTPIILGLDVTGSMGYLAEEIAKTALNEIILTTYKDKPVEDPQIMIMAIGDMFSDCAPLQVTQFESDIRIAEQLSELYFEGRGGGNGGESYLAARYFAAKHTAIDSHSKHGKKGYLFTIGDEPNHKWITRDQIKRFFNDDVSEDITSEQLLKEVSEKYHVYYICVGRYKYYNSDEKWRKLLDERVYTLDDHTQLPKLITQVLKLTAENEEKTKQYKESNLPKNKDSMHISF
jgi:hypothetical protein